MNYFSHLVLFIYSFVKYLSRFHHAKPCARTWEYNAKQGREGPALMELILYGRERNDRHKKHCLQRPKV